MYIHQQKHSLIWESFLGPIESWFISTTLDIRISVTHVKERVHDTWYNMTRHNEHFA